VTEDDRRRTTDNRQSDLRARVAAYLETHTTLALATAGPDGVPQAAPLFYASDAALNLIFLSAPDSRHSLNLARNPAAAASIYDEVWEWQAIRGLQIEGSVERLEGAERERALVLYQTKYPFVSAFGAEVERSAFYRLHPRWLRYIDNSIAFGWHEELTLELD
jgi:uncharacterized protein YhbP (UPF0306 family)